MQVAVSSVSREMLVEVVPEEREPVGCLLLSPGAVISGAITVKEIPVDVAEDTIIPY